MTNLQLESCLKGYPATVCCPDELPVHVGVRSRTFLVHTDTCDRGGRVRVRVRVRGMKLVLINADHEEDTLDNIYERRGMTLVSVLFV